MTCFRMPNGETLSHYCKRFGYNYNLIFTRIDKGMTIEQAIKDFKKRKQKAPYHCQSFFKYCRDNGLDYYSIKQRMYRSNCSVDEAVDWWKRRQQRKHPFYKTA